MLARAALSITTACTLWVAEQLGILCLFLAVVFTFGGISDGHSCYISVGLFYVVFCVSRCINDVLCMMLISLLLLAIAALINL